MRCRTARRSSPSGARSRLATASPAICIHDREEPPMTVAREWAAYCRATSSVPLADDIRARARLCVADHLHAAMHGARSETATMLRRYFGRERGAAAVSAESAALYA